MIYKEDIEKSRQRVEAWWNHEIIDRMVIQATAPRTPQHDCPIDSPSGDRELKRFFTDPESVIPRLKNQIASTWYGGEAFPVMFPVSIGMVAILANYLGSPMRFVDTHTTWSDPIITDWSTRPEFRFHRDNQWWQTTERLLKAGVEQAAGCYVGIPDLNGPTQILSELRGMERYALDFIDNPGEILPCLTEINNAWFEVWQACTEITNQTGGHFFWMGIWSDKPAVDLQSDVSCLISNTLFRKYFIPSLEEQTRMAERTIYHLDGPGAVQHVNSLLDLPHLDGIQWVPGAGSKPAAAWIWLLKKIQDSGKLVYVSCGKQDIRELMEQLKPEGLMISTTCDTPDEARELLKKVEKWTARKKRV